MTINVQVTNVLNSTISAVKTVLPCEVEVKKPAFMSQPLIQESVSVLIGITGDIPGRLVIEGTENCISKVGETMIGMPIEGEMLESFAAELGNMIAGNMATSLAHLEHLIDITPPTVIIGTSKMYGFDKAIHLPILLPNIGQLSIVLMVKL